MALHNMRKFAAFDDFPRQDRSILSAQDCFCCFVWLCFGNMVYLHYRFGLHPSWYFPKQLKDLHICSICEQKVFFIFIAKDKKIIIIYNKINQNIKVFFLFCLLYMKTTALVTYFIWKYTLSIIDWKVLLCAFCLQDKQKAH